MVSIVLALLVSKSCSVSIFEDFLFFGGESLLVKRCSNPDRQSYSVGWVSVFVCMGIAVVVSMPRLISMISFFPFATATQYHFL